MTESQLSATEALQNARTGDIWLFRGRKLADRAIQVATTSPINHVAMAVALDDLPPLLWHTEIGRSLEDVWTGNHNRGAQLNLLSDAIEVWTEKYDQQAWVRHLDAEITTEMEDQLLRVIAAYQGRPFPRTRQLAGKWVSGRIRREASETAVYCAQLVAITYRKMGLLDPKKPANWYDPGRFWSGHDLELRGGTLGPEIAVAAPG
ncbi:MAG: hypothetical protein ACERLM_04940 [Acidimicrobiales bacterium]